MVEIIVSICVFLSLIDSNTSRLLNLQLFVNLVGTNSFIGSLFRVQEQRLEWCLLTSATSKPTCCLFLCCPSMSDSNISSEGLHLDHEMKAQGAHCSIHNILRSNPDVAIRLRLGLLESSRNHQQISTN
ncbi:hypothetical protein BHE74_00035300 [Ensete ventricosum]|nr:hypothetical protein BHE74_00035300 [Ensete ventricosum]